MRKIRTLTFVIITSCMVIVNVLPRLNVGTVAQAEESWKTEFDAICVKTSEAASLPKAEVLDLIERCDKLKPRIEALDESSKKVYLKRLQMCRDLFVYILESSPQ